MLRSAISDKSSKVLLLLFFFSGFSSLIYEVLWLKQLTRLFGSSAYAMATTLAVFFLGLFLGSLFWGRKSSKIKQPLRAYALIEIGIAASAILYFFILDAYFLIYSPLFNAFGHNPLLFTIIKFILAIGLLLLPSFFMGGTFPLITQIFATKSPNPVNIASLTYAFNTLGAAGGAFIAGFYLPPTIGLQRAYLGAMILNVLIALVALRLDKSLFRDAGKTASRNKRARHRSLKFGHMNLGLVAFLSGFIALSLEVLWSRMFAQVLMNDTYSFAAILITFLIALALGSFLANYLTSRGARPAETLKRMALLSAISVAASPLIFNFWTDGLSLLPVAVGWGRYMASMLSMMLVVMMVPAILIGSIFPLLLEAAKGWKQSLGESVGLLSAYNTLGAIIGSLSAGFIMLNLLGLWRSIALMAAAYVFLVSMLTEAVPRKRAAFVATGLSIITSFWLISGIPNVRLDEANAEQLQDIYQGRDGIVAVISAQPPYYPENFQDLFIKLNNTYTLGGLGSAPDERRQSHLALFLHANPRSVYILGMATGITAGGALAHPVQRLVVSELIPEVVRAAQAHFGASTNGLFEDERVEIVIEDGRNYLLGTTERFDVIIADLFEPWGAGTGDLYSLQHFETVRRHLKTGGLFVQWLPLYQISMQEFGIIAQTLMQVFPQVTLWRGNFVPNKPIVALIAQDDIVPLNGEMFVSNVQMLNGGGNSEDFLIDALVSVKGYPVLKLDPGSRDFLVQLLPQLEETVPFTFYAGNISQNAQLFQDFQINTDDKPVIEFLAPKTRGNQSQAQNGWLTSFALDDFFQELFTNLPPSADPYLQNLTPEQLGYVQAGMSYYRSLMLSYEAQFLDNEQWSRESRLWLDDYLEKMGLREGGL